MNGHPHNPKNIQPTQICHSTHHMPGLLLDLFFSKTLKSYCLIEWDMYTPSGCPKGVFVLSFRPRAYLQLLFSWYSVAGSFGNPWNKSRLLDFIRSNASTLTKHLKCTEVDINLRTQNNIVKLTMSHHFSKLLKLRYHDPKIRYDSDNPKKKILKNFPVDCGDR